VPAAGQDRRGAAAVEREGGYAFAGSPELAGGRHPR